MFTAGVAAGTAVLVEATLLQQHGIGGPIKIGNEGVISAVAGLEAWAAEDHAGRQSALKRRAEAAIARLGAVLGVRATQ